MAQAKSMEKHATHVITGFELSKKALYNSSQYGIKGVTLNVLWYLTTCYNHKHPYVYPKQKTIAKIINASERSVVRAIQELVNKGLIIVECKYSNRYVFTSKILGEQPENKKIFAPKEMSHQERQNVIKQSDKMSHHDIEQIREHIKEQTNNKVEDYKILKEYAKKKKAKNIEAYIFALKRNGSASNIIQEYKAKQARKLELAKLKEEEKRREAKEKAKEEAENNKPLSEKYTYETACTFLRKVSKHNKSFANRGFAKELVKTFNIDVEKLLSV